MATTTRACSGIAAFRAATRRPAEQPAKYDMQSQFQFTEAITPRVRTVGFGRSRGSLQASLVENEDGLSKPIRTRVPPHFSGTGRDPSASEMASIDRHNSRRKGSRKRHGKDENDYDED